MEEENQQEEERENLEAEPLKDGSDICQQLMDRYAKSKAPQHRHLLATAAAMRSILEAESLPLTPQAYFAAAISAIDNASSSETLDSTAIAALSSFLAITLPSVPPQGITGKKASEAVGVLVDLLGRKSVAVSSVRAVVKCLGILVGFCDLEDWGLVKLGFETLLKFSVDRRPKVRRCAQECMEKLLKSLGCSDVITEASKTVFSLLESYLPLAVKLSSSATVDGSKDEDMSKPEHLEVLHVLNLLAIIAPFLSGKVILKLLKKLDKLVGAHFSPITRHVFKIIEAIFNSSRVEEVVPEIESIINSVGSYISLGKKNHLDTVLSAVNLLKHGSDILHDREPSSRIRNLRLVCGYMAGLLTSEATTSSHASSVLRLLISSNLDQEVLLIPYQPLENSDHNSMEVKEIKKICGILENILGSCDGVPNEPVLEVLSALFLKLGELSSIFLTSIVLKLANFINLAQANSTIIDTLRSCLGAAVIAMGPEKILNLVPISINADGFTPQNMWLVPILKDYVVGASLTYYLEHIVPLAKSFQRAFIKVKKSKQGKDLRACAHGLWKLLPAFCRQPTDMQQNIGNLTEFIIKFLKKDSFMHEDIAIALQVLVKQNKSVLNPKIDVLESNSDMIKDTLMEFRNVPRYSKETATRNIKVLVSSSSGLLQALMDLFVDSPATKCSYLKDAIGCLASVTDSVITKSIFISLLERFQFVDDKGEFEVSQSDADQLTDKEQGNPKTTEKDVWRRVMLELASSIVEGANEDLIDLIYSFVKCTFQASNEMSRRETYHALSRVLEEHSSLCSSRFEELIKLLLGLKPPDDIVCLRSRFACFRVLIVHSLKISSEEEENTGAFLILNEIILTLKDAKEEEGRKAAYDALLSISSNLKSSSSTSPDELYHKLVSMIMGYLSGGSPHIKSGAVSALSVLVYADINICLSEPDLVPSLLSLLQGKAVEVIKAVLGFVKVLVSSLPAKDLQNILSDAVGAILPWSSVSRNHFKSKVTIVLEILVRKCGSAAVELVTPEKYKRFTKSVIESRHSKTDSKDAGAPDRDSTFPDSFTKGSDLSFFTGLSLLHIC